MSDESSEDPRYGTVTREQVEAEARALLERRQQVPRQHAANAPHDDLQLVEAGTAYLARQLGELSDADLDAPSLLPGWPRSNVISHLGYNARALTHLIEWVQTGVMTPMYRDEAERQHQIDSGAQLPPTALRVFFENGAAELDSGWRELSDEQWDFPVARGPGRTFAMRESVWMRAREVWIHAIDLGGSASFDDFPVSLIDRLSADVVANWARRGETPDLTLAPTDRAIAPDAGRIVLGRGSALVSGSAAALCRWLTGRGSEGVESSNALPELPAWI